ncbi:hypothetical protein [Aphanizomenon flos-aquae]|uniref:hypothetical protein n=1 Tax=Aphanizomenon flos-aquae TaxID=1176 RepID=UPI000A889A56|nr:hypothetical protein [Aphanizomenon flos-aquae]
MLMVKKIGQRKAGESPEEAKKIVFTEYDLVNNDQVAVGDIIFDIGVETELEKQKTPYIPVAE